MLECNLIKEHRPKYNTMLKDDKAYPYIKVTVNEDFPRILFSHQMKKDKAKYFGPYTSAGAVKDTIELLRKLYDIRSCNKSLPKEIGKDRPCLYYHIHQCKAPCQGYISKEEYGEQIKKAISFLNGNYNDMIKELTGKMTEAAEEMRFEQAAEYRDLIDSVRRIGERQKITNSNGEDKDVIALAMDKEDAVAQVFFIRNGKLIGREHYYLRIGEEEQKSEVLLTFMKQFYSGTPFIPREIMISEEIAEQELMEEYLSSKRGQKVRIRVPKKGSKEKMVELAERNAQIVLDQDRERIKREEGRTVGAVKEIARWLNLPSIDHRGVRYLQYQRFPVGRLNDRLRERKAKARRLPKIQDQIRRGTERLRQYERGLKPPFSARHPGGQRFRAAAGPDHDGRRTRPG